MTNNQQISQNLRAWLMKLNEMMQTSITHQQGLLQWGGDAEWAKEAISREQVAIDNFQKTITQTEQWITLADQEKLVDPRRG